MKSCTIHQPKGIGDILVCEPIARHYFKQGYKIFWPVVEPYFWIKNYIQYIDFSITNAKVFPSTKFDTDNIILNLINAPGHWILDKYSLAKVDRLSWLTYNWTRDLNREKQLYEELNLTKPYCLINKNFYTQNVHSNIEMKTKEKNIIEMSFYKDFSLLDWGLVLENASEIHTMDTSLVWLIESSILNVNCEIHLYPRLEHTNKINVKDVLRKSWIYHD